MFLDSARVHGGDATWEIVYGLLSSKHVKLVWLPKYSPEFNPVELYWRYMKTNIRNLPVVQDFEQLQEICIDLAASVPMDYILEWFLEAMTKWQESEKK